MAAVYSTRFIMAQGLNGDAFYVVPTGFKAVVRDVDTYCTTGSDFRLMGPAMQTFCYWMGASSLGGAPNFSWRGRQVLEAGERLTARSVSPLDVTVSGYLLTLP